MKWKRVWARDYSVQYCEIALLAIGKKVKRFLPVYMKKQILFPENKNECMYYEEEEENKFIKALVENFSGDPQKFNSFVKLFHKFGKEYVHSAKKVNLTNLTNFKNPQLKKIYLDYQKKVLDYSVFLSIAYLLNEYWSEYGTKILKIKDDAVKEALFRPLKRSTVLKMHETASKIKGDKVEIGKFWKEYQWLPCLDLQNKPWSLKEVEDYISNLKSGGAYKTLNFKEAVKKAGLNAEEIENFKIIKELAYLKDLRDDFRRKGIFYIQKLFVEIGQRIGLELNELAYLTEEEIIKLLDEEKIDLHKIKKRREGFMMYVKDDKVICIDHNINEELRNLGFTKEEKKITEIKGIMACKGKARGIVKIVKTVHDILKINKGDILVAITTHPDYVPAMQKVAAIITDEGGILSHAAIVSRELGIPCLVGTKNATKVLQQGEEVEVNATEGIVKIVKKNKLR